MNIRDRKNNIIETLQSINDEQLIEEVYELLHPNEAVEDITVDDLPAELQDKIKRAMEDYRNGRYIKHNQLKQKVEEWLTS